MGSEPSSPLKCKKIQSEGLFYYQKNSVADLIISEDLDENYESPNCPKQPLKHSYTGLAPKQNKILMKKLLPGARESESDG